MPIRAYDVLILMATTMGLLAAGWRAAAWRLARRVNDSGPERAHGSPSLQYRLHDLLLVMVVVGVVVWAAQRIAVEGTHIRTWWRLPLHAGTLAIVASAAVWFTQTTRKLPAAGLLIVLIVAAAASEFWILEDWMDPYFVYRTVAVLAIDYVLFAAACGAYSLLGQTWQQPWNASFASRFARGFSALAGLALLFFCIWIYSLMLVVPWGPAPSSSGPNVSPRVFQLSASLQNASPAQTAAICDQLVDLLQQPGRSVLDWEAARHDPFGQNSVDRFTAPRLAGRALTAECDRLKAARRHDEAADYAVSILRLGAMLAREGSDIDVQVGQVIDVLGSSKLAELRSALSKSKRQALIQILREHSNNWEPLDTVFDRTERWDLWTARWRHSLFSIQQQRWPLGTPHRLMISNMFRRCEAFQHLLIVDLAIRNYREDHGTWPASLELLVPGYLDVLPLDPWSGQSLLYRPTEPDFVLYSVGWDGDDDGGHGQIGISAPMYKPGWDMSLDALTKGQ